MIMCDYNCVRSPTDRILEDLTAMNGRTVKRPPCYANRLRDGMVLCIKGQYVEVLLFIPHFKRLAKNLVGRFRCGDGLFPHVAWLDFKAPPNKLKRSGEFQLLGLADTQHSFTRMQSVVIFNPLGQFAPVATYKARKRSERLKEPPRKLNDIAPVSAGLQHHSQKRYVIHIARR